jgi:acyl-coenzyme A thioesterase PaaI-like protein
MDESPLWRDPNAAVTRWIPDGRPPEGQWAALLRLAAGARDLVDLLAGSDAPEAELTAAAEAVEAVVTRLSASPRGRSLWGFAETSNAGSPRAMFDNSPVSGLANPIAPPLRLSLGEGVVRGSVTFGTAYEGPPGHVHGGIVAAVLDEGLGMVQSLSGSSGMTGTLAIRYRRPTPLHREIRFEGRVDRVEGRKIFTTGTLSDGDTLCAEAEGVFISVDFERMRALAFDR